MDNLKHNTKVFQENFIVDVKHYFNAMPNVGADEYNFINEYVQFELAMYDWLHVNKFIIEF